MIRRILYISLLFVFIESYAIAATNTFTASTGRWDTDENWSLGHAPLSTEDVVVALGDSSQLYIDSAKTVASLSVTTNSVNNHDMGLLLDGNLTISGTFSMTNNNTQIRSIIRSYTIGVQRTITAATVSITGSLDIEDILGAGAGSWDLSSINSGNCGGNSGITFRSPRTYYAVMADGKQDYDNIWSTSSGGSPGGTSVFPLPQDTIVFNNSSFSTPGSIFLFHFGGNNGNVDASAVTTSHAISLPRKIHGNVNYTGSGLSNAGDYSIINIDARLKNESSQVLTISVTPTITTTIGVASNGGTIRLGTNITETNTLTFSEGTIDVYGHTLTVDARSGSGTFTDSVGGGKVVSGGSTYWSATYYVKSGGNDALSGWDDANAWETIAKVNSTVTSGATVYFRSQDTWTAGTGGTMVVATAGVRYDGSSYGSGTRATLKPTGKLAGTGNHQAIVVIDASNVTFSGFDIDGNQQNNIGVRVGWYASSNIENITINNCLVHGVGDGSEYQYSIIVSCAADPAITVSNVTITNNRVYDASHDGISIYPSWTSVMNHIDTVLIRNNVVHDIGVRQPDYGDGSFLCQYSTGVSVANDSTNVVAEFNDLYNVCTGLSINTSDYEGFGSPTNITYRYNNVHDVLSMGYVNIVGTYGIVDGSGEIYGNLFYNIGRTGGTFNNGYGWMAGKTPGDGYSNDINIHGNTAFGDGVFSFYNNTIYSNSNYSGTVASVVIAYEMDLTDTGSVFNFKNNIIYVSSGYPALIDQFNRLAGTHSNNLFYRTSGANDTHVAAGGTNYNRAGVTTWELTAQNTDPTFTGGTLPTGFTGTYGVNMTPNTNYFAITSGNALNNGANLGSPYNIPINTAGVSIPAQRGTVWDIGAYEYSMSGGSGFTGGTLGSGGSIR
jgi:hypothetical protein